MREGLDFFRDIGGEMGMEEDELDKFFHITAEAADFIAYLEETEFDFYAGMKAFFEENGHLYIWPGYTVEGHDIYREFSYIRSHKNLLTPEYRKKYDDIGMDWDIPPQWMYKYWVAVEYSEEFGNIDVPSGLGKYHDVWLYDWLKRNRLNKNRLHERQIALLDSIGMDWTIVDPWEEKFKELVQYKEKHGHCDVPGDEGPLGSWVAKLRERPPEGERKERLDALGFEWDGRKSRSRNAWRAGVKHSREYWTSHGDLKVPA